MINAILAALTAFAMVAASTLGAAACIPIMTADGASLTYDQGGARYTIYYKDLPAPKNPSAPVNIRFVRDTLQGLVDQRIPLVELEIDDEARITPQLDPWHYWSDEAGNPKSTLPGATHLTKRCAEVFEVFWDGANYRIGWARTW